MWLEYLLSGEMLRKGKKSYTQKANVPFQAFTLGLQAKMNQETPKRKAAKKADPVQQKDQLVHQATTGNKGYTKPGHR